LIGSCVFSDFYEFPRARHATVTSVSPSKPVAPFVQVENGQSIFSLDSHHTARINGVPIVYPCESLLIETGTDKVRPIVERKEQIRPAPAESGETEHGMSESCGRIGIRREDSHKRAKVD
jgi:hypothetical protein